jgi:hypothetical protein
MLLYAANWLGERFQMRPAGIVAHGFRCSVGGVASEQFKVHDGKCYQWTICWGVSALAESFEKCEVGFAYRHAIWTPARSLFGDHRTVAIAFGTVRQRYSASRKCGCRSANQAVCFEAHLRRAAKLLERAGY